MGVVRGCNKGLLKHVPESILAAVGETTIQLRFHSQRKIRD